MGLVTGFFTYVDGTTINGSAQFQLSGDCVATAACYSPLVISFPVTSGTLSCSVVFNDVLSPSGSTYQITVKDLYLSQVWGGKYSLTGTAANLNTLVPM